MSGDDYVYRVRGALARLACPELEAEDVRSALEAARHVSVFDVDAPTRSDRREVAVAKEAAKRAVRWYVRYLADQVRDFANATIGLGEAVVARLERLEASGAAKDAELAGRLGQLEARVAELEERAEPERSAPGAG